MATHAVSLKLELQLRSLTGRAPTACRLFPISNTEGSIRLQDGEPAVVAGEITSNDHPPMTGIPGLSSIPGLNLAHARQQPHQRERRIAHHPHPAHSRQSRSSHGRNLGNGKIVTVLTFQIDRRRKGTGHFQPCHPNRSERPVRNLLLSASQQAPPLTSASPQTPPTASKSPPERYSHSQCCAH